MAVVNPEARIAVQKTSVADARAQRDLLASRIADLLLQYSRETGAIVDSVYTSPEVTFEGDVRIYLVEVSVRL